MNGQKNRVWLTALLICVAESASCAPASEVDADVSDAVVINAPIEKVWRLLSEVNGWPNWDTSVAYAKIDGPLAMGTEFHWRSGDFDVDSVLEDVTPITRLSWHGKATGTFAFHEWRLTAAGLTTTVWTHETLQGWLPHLFAGTARDGLVSTLRDRLESLKRAAEKP